MCSLGADIQAYTRRFEIYDMLSSCTEEPDEVVFCSPGVFGVIDGYYCGSANLVRPMACAFGGDLDFVQGCTARDVIDQLRRLLAEGRRLRRAVLPDAMFWLDGGFDLDGHGVDSIRDAFPEISVELVPVPRDVVFSVVDLDDCLAFFDDPRRRGGRTARIQQNR
jgi:hypothetical protein